MKKALSLLLALVLCLSLCACDADSKKIPLTKDNLETYFKVTAYIEEAIGYYAEKDFNAVAKLEAVSGNFNYENVSVTFKITKTGKGDFNLDVPCEAEVTVTTNIVGEGFTSVPLWADEMAVGGHANSLSFLNGSKSTWEIVSISGYVVPVG